MKLRDWLFQRTVIEIMILVFTLAVAFVITIASITIFYVKAKDPTVDVDRSVDALMSILTTILGALLGLIAGKASSSNGSAPVNGSAKPSVEQPFDEKE